MKIGNDDDDCSWYQTKAGGFNTENKARDTQHWLEHGAKPMLLMQEYNCGRSRGLMLIIMNNNKE